MADGKKLLDPDEARRDVLLQIGVVVGFLLLAGFGLGWIAVQDAAKAVRLAREGVTVQGEVVDIVHRSSRQIRANGMADPINQVEVRFKTREWRLVNAVAPVRRTFRLGLSPGQAVDVAYWPRDPVVVRVDPGYLPQRLALLGVPVVAAFGLAGAAVVLGRRHGNRLAHVLRYGQPQTALVTAHRPVIFGNVRVVWALPDGRSGRSRMMHANEARAFPVGSEVRVRVAPGDPRLWWERELSA